MVIGISTDTLETQKKFTEKEKLNYPLYADDGYTASKAFGTLSPGGKTAQRMTFVINKEGVIAKIYNKVGPASHPDDVLEYVKTNLKK